MMKLIRALALLALTVAPAAAQQMQLGAGHVIANVGSSPARGGDTVFSAVMDKNFGSTRGSIAERGASGWSAITPGTAGLPLVSNGSGADPSYQIVPLTGGGTGAAITGTSGAVPYFSSSSTMGTSAALTNFGPVIGGGAGNPPSTVAAGSNNQAFMGNTAGAPVFRALTGTDLPFPGASSLGGIESVTCNTHTWLDVISTAGVPTCAQPNFTDLAGTASLAQGGLGGSQSAATANQIPVYPGGGAAVPTTVGGSGGFFDTICSSTIGQHWVRLTGGWGCTSLGFSNPVWWGADPTGTNDSTTAITNAQSANSLVVFPTGTFKVSSVFTMAAGQTFQGQGMYSTRLISSSTTGHMILVPNNVGYVTISDLSLQRSVTASTNADGIIFAGDSEVTVLRNLWIQQQYNALVLSTTAYARAENIVLSINQGSGLVMGNTASSGSMQWILDNILSQSNGLYGFFITTVSGPSGATLGEMSRLFTFGNSSYGFYAAGSSGVPISAIRMSNSFFGGDGNNEVELDTYSTYPHVLTNVFTEAAGTGLTGPAGSTPASNVGDGFNFTANNNDVELIGCNAYGHSQHGINSLAGALGIIGGNYRANGAAAATPGITIGAASTVRIIGVRSGNSPQNYGIALGAAAINGIISSNDVANNSSAGILNSSTGSTLRIIDNAGYNPVGLTAGTSTGTSGTSICAGPSPETHYITQSATFNAAVKSGSTTLCTVATATVPCVIDLGPNECYSVAGWSTTQPTYSKFVH